MSEPIRIRPEYSLILQFDVVPGKQQVTYRFMESEMVKTMQSKQVYRYGAWHMLYGNYPEWRIEFVAEDMKYVKRLLAESAWSRMENKLKALTHNYSRRVVPYRSFQI